MNRIYSNEAMLYILKLSHIVFQLASQQPKSFGDKLSVYFSDTWNLVDAFSLLAFVVAAFMRFFDSTFEAARIILSLNIIVFIVRSLQIFSVNRQLGPKLVMIRKMVRFCELSKLYDKTTSLKKTYNVNLFSETDLVFGFWNTS